MGADQYSVIGTVERVEAWSTIRLPFEPKGWLLQYRNDLRAALREMRATDGSVLCAEYASPDSALADVENVLLYNVGTGCYSHLVGQGLVCRRLRSGDELHRVRYTVTERIDWPEFAGPVLATARHRDRVRGEKPLPWWRAFRESLVVQSRGPYQGPFAVSVELGAEWPRGGLSSPKALLDGLISALHVHDGSSLESITQCFETLGDGARLWGLLNDPTCAILGARRLVRPHGSMLAWNPADERCWSFRLIRSEAEDAVDAAISAIDPRVDAGA
jgi:hypothetical protein